MSQLLEDDYAPATRNPWPSILLAALLAAGIALALALLLREGKE